MEEERGSAVITIHESYERLCWLVLLENIDVTHFTASEDCDDCLKQQLFFFFFFMDYFIEK